MTEFEKNTICKSYRSKFLEAKRDSGELRCPGTALINDTSATLDYFTDNCNAVLNISKYPCTYEKRDELTLSPLSF